MHDIVFLKKRLVALLFVLFFLCSLVPVFGLYPDYEDIYINDFAQILKSEEASSIQSMLEKLKSDEGIEAVLVSIESYKAFNTGDSNFESFVTALFNFWGVGNSEFNNGIMVLFSLRDRKVRIELGSGYSPEYDDVMKSIIDHKILPFFREEQYGSGLVRGIEALYAYFTNDEIPTNDQESSSSLWIFLVLSGGGLGIAGIAFLRQFLRMRPRICPECKVQMNLLSEFDDDKHLNQGELKEEQIGSIDYDVWICPQCKSKTQIPYKKWFSGFRGCPRCSYQTLKVTRRVIQPATYTSSGLGREESCCAQCKYHSESNYTIARLQRSSSSSGSSSSSSFGGGSSSGGGASGGW